MKKILSIAWRLAGALIAIVALALAVASIGPAAGQRSVAAGIGISFLYYTNISGQGSHAVFKLTNAWGSAIEYGPALAQVQANGSWAQFYYASGSPTLKLAAHQTAVFIVQVPDAAVWRVPVGVGFPPQGLHRAKIWARGLRERLWVWWYGAPVTPKPLDIRVINTVYSPVMRSEKPHNSNT